MAGKVMDWYHASKLPERALITGNQCKIMAKPKSKSRADTNGGKDRPSKEPMRTA